MTKRKYTLYPQQIQELAYSNDVKPKEVMDWLETVGYGHKNIVDRELVGVPECVLIDFQILFGVRPLEADDTWMTLSQLAKSMGVRPSSVYYWFNNRPSLHRFAYKLHRNKYIIPPLIQYCYTSGYGSISKVGKVPPGYLKLNDYGFTYRFFRKYKGKLRLLRHKNVLYINREEGEWLKGIYEELSMAPSNYIELGKFCRIEDVNRRTVRAFFFRKEIKISTFRRGQYFLSHLSPEQQALFKSRRRYKKRKSEPDTNN